MKRSRKVLLCGIVFLAVVAWVVWVCTATGPRETARMANGAIVTLQQVTTGKEHRFVYGSAWQRFRSRLPEKWFGKSGAVVLTHRTTNDSVVAWLAGTGKPGTLMSDVPNYVVVNDRDQRVSVVGSVGWQFVSKELLIEGRELVIPRHGQRVRLRLYELDASSKPVCAGEFTVPLPSSHDAPAWKPEPLPIRRVDAGVEFTLIRFTAENEVRAERGFATALNTVTFQIAEHGQRSTNWQLRTIYASDALGNRNFYGVYSHTDGNGDESWTGTWLLWPDEPAWKLRLEFARRRDFAPDELWNVQGIPVPSSDSVAPKSFQTNRQGVSLLVRGITDAQGLLPDGKMSVNATTSVLDLTWTPSPPGLQVSLLEVKDERGQKVEVRGSVGGDHGAVGYGLNISSNVHSVNALFAVRRSRFIELLAKPESVTNSPVGSGPK